MMDLLMDVFENIKHDVVDLINNNENRIVVFNAELLLTNKKISKEPVNKNEMINLFYQTTGFSQLKIYVDELRVNFEEEGYYDKHINTLYCHYNNYMGGSPIFLPCILLSDLTCWIYNTFFIYPYVSICYFNNPKCVNSTVFIVLRKSSVQQI